MAASIERVGPPRLARRLLDTGRFFFIAPSLLP